MQKKNREVLLFWPLVLGFALSGIVQAVVSHQAMAKAPGGDSPKNLTLATLFGIVSSSCSYVAVAADFSQSG
jgi:uncharacterized membrane protein YraQ (UPF0718 family)